MSTVLERWNSLDPQLAASEILPCCGSQSWAAELAARRPIGDADHLQIASDAAWFGLPAEAWQEAFDSHPRIGQQKAKAATNTSLEWSASEQSAALSADDNAKRALEQANRRYEERFGRIFIVCASGKSAAEILALLEARVENDPVTELHAAAEQQRQITQLRLQRWLEGRIALGISTHILDTAVGMPAADVPVSLASWQSDEWVLLTDTATDKDGRVKQLLSAEQAVEQGLYRLRFGTASYYEAQRLRGLYPYIDIVFEVSSAEQHYHVPLLLTANGYTTYRGS